ncbi:MAG: patatin-like phospholipase family protein [Chitinophagaceae bacterium]|nr:patatin-like phospholipase family protein [Chitinophagaceae bacterium]
MSEKKNIGITLSGGGFRGIAHLGILKYLFEQNIKPDVISGASVGSLIGAFIAHGYAPDEILQFSKKEKLFSYSDFFTSRGGLFSTIVFEKLIKKYIPHDSFENLKIPLYVAVTDITHAKSLIFKEGSLSFAIKSSCCFPLVFQPVLYNKDTYLCDGGLLNNFPVEQLRSICNKVIGINVDPISTLEGPLGYKTMIARIIRMTTALKAINSKQLCDIYLQPDELNNYSTFKTNKTDAIFQLGYDYAKGLKNDFLALKKV